MASENDLEFTIILKGSYEDSVVPNGFLEVRPVKRMEIPKTTTEDTDFTPAGRRFTVMWGKLPQFIMKTRHYPEWNAKFFKERQNGIYEMCLDYNFKVDYPNQVKTMTIPTK